ncbi:hypothetical protein Dda_4725 [Drechslerella dactyloides]|uniref:Uncharacterized protein n=1 Tax=Drechslerella dactyloides TaxID=74499 RepID=A0AAD6NJD4_DREDA|nr:hypothetical protein Dda_4725 [Drechslerella dactyloides]
MRRGLRFGSLGLTLLYSLSFLSRPVQGAWDVNWRGKIMAVEFNRVFYTPDPNERKAYLTAASCLLDGSLEGKEGFNETVGVASVVGGLPDSIRNQDVWSTNAWQNLNCPGDPPASQWSFVGNNGTKGTKINDNAMGVALHDYAIGQFRNTKTRRCVSLIRNWDADKNANIETVGHALRSIDCDPTSKDKRQLWVIYYNGPNAPFAPFIPASELGACLGFNTKKDDKGVWTYDRVPGGVYEDTAEEINLRQVDARYVSMSTFNSDDASGVSPVVRCTGMKWVFGPGFSKDMMDPEDDGPVPEMAGGEDAGFDPDAYSARRALRFRG